MDKLTDAIVFKLIQHHRVLVPLSIGFLIAMFVFEDKETFLAWGKGAFVIAVSIGGAGLAWLGWLHVKSAILGIDTGVSQPEEDLNSLGSRSAGFFLGLVFMTLGVGAVYGGFDFFMRKVDLIS